MVRLGRGAAGRERGREEEGRCREGEREEEGNLKEKKKRRREEKKENMMHTRHSPMMVWTLTESFVLNINTLPLKKMNSSHCKIVGM